jgi:quercetin dioxygenase-like cupin family protein
MPPTAPQVWPDDLDALIAAPGYHSLLLENESVRVLDTTVPPGHTVPHHTHRWPAVHYIITWSDFVRRDLAGAVLLDTRNTPKKPAPGSTLWSGPFPLHTLENVGDSDLHVLSVEIKAK